MKSSITVSILLLLISTARLSFAGNFRCLGSDGGTPFSNVTSDVSAKQTILKSNGLVRDFVYHEKLNQIVYRNVRNQVRVLHLENLHDHLLAYLDGKMSRVSEDDLGRILPANFTYYLDTTKGSVWHKYGRPNKVAGHLFIEKGDIFSLETFWQENSTLLKNGNYYFRFFTYESEKPWRRQCYIPGNVGTDLKLAKGNLYPYIHFYAIKKGLLEDKVVVYRMAINQVGWDRPCPIEEVTQYPYSNLGPIKAFYHFNIDSVDAYAFHLADPKRNLFWDKPGECAYYNFNGKVPVFISPKHGVFASWKNGKELALHNLKYKTEVTLFKNLNQTEISGENLSLSDDGKTLFSSLSTSHDQGGRLIVETDLGNF